MLNSVQADSGFILPGKEKIGDKRIWKPGALGNMLLGFFAALISWGLYGPLSQATIIPLKQAAGITPTLTVATFVGAVLVGAGGSKIITSEIEKKVLSATASSAATLKSDPTTAAAIATAPSPTEALRAVENAQAAETLAAETPAAETPAAETEESEFPTAQSVASKDATHIALEDPPPKPPAVSQPNNIPEQIKKLAELKDTGAITNEEFETKKKDLLDRM